MRPIDMFEAAKLDAALADVERLTKELIPTWSARAATLNRQAQEAGESGWGFRREADAFEHCLNSLRRALGEKL